MEKYIFLEKLGNGTYGNVHRVYKKETDEFFACKKFKWEYDSEEDAEKEIEVEVLRKLNHPNIIKVEEIV